MLYLTEQLLPLGLIQVHKILFGGMSLIQVLALDDKLDVTGSSQL